MLEDLLLIKAEAMTAAEVVCMEAWLRAAQEGAADKARAVLRTGLLVEHYLSNLPAVPGERTVEQSERLDHLQREFGRALELIGGPVVPYP